MTDVANEEGRARRDRKPFRIEYGVAVRIESPPERVWALLTDVDGMASWNSTIEHAEGTIALGAKVRLRVTIAPEREFSLRVDELEPNRRLVWTDGFMPIFRGVRTYTLEPLDGAAATRFEMVEVLRGLMLPMIARSLPDFTEPFEDYARDLKRAAEG